MTNGLRNTPCSLCDKDAEFYVGQIVYQYFYGDGLENKPPTTIAVCREHITKVRLNRIDGKRISKEEYFELMYPDEKLLYGKTV